MIDLVCSWRDLAYVAGAMTWAFVGISMEPTGGVLYLIGSPRGYNLAGCHGQLIGTERALPANHVFLCFNPIPLYILPSFLAEMVSSSCYDHHCWDYPEATF